MADETEVLQSIAKKPLDEAPKAASIPCASHDSPGRGGSFISLGGGVIVPASEADQG